MQWPVSNSHQKAESTMWYITPILQKYVHVIQKKYFKTNFYIPNKYLFKLKLKLFFKDNYIYTTQLMPIFNTQADNAMLCHSLGWAVILFSLQHFIAPALDLMPCLPS